MIDFAKEARDLQVAISENAYPAADGTADIDNHALPIIEVTLREIARRATDERGKCSCGTPLSRDCPSCARAWQS
jgi:hypothetical protein